jgi:hypothetical protein
MKSFISHPLARYDDLILKEYTTTMSNQKAIKKSSQKKPPVWAAQAVGGPKACDRDIGVGLCLGFFEATALIEGGVTGFGLFFLGSLGRRVVLDVVPCIKAVRTVAIIFYHEALGCAVNFA